MKSRPVAACFLASATLFALLCLGAGAGSAPLCGEGGISEFGGCSAPRGSRQQDPAGEDTRRTRLRTIGDWIITGVGPPNEPAYCFAALAPSRASPPRDGVYLLVSGKVDPPEPSFAMGYRLSAQARIEVSVGDQLFPFFTDGEFAWTAQVADEAPFRAALLAAESMTLTSRGANRAPIADTYTLKDVAEALAAMKSCEGQGVAAMQPAPTWPSRAGFSARA